MIDGDNSDDRRNVQAKAGGIFIALGLVFGIVGGLILGEVSAGMVIGLGIGIAMALLVWALERAR